MSPDEALQNMAETFKSRNNLYGDNYKNLGNVIEAIMRGPVTLNTSYDYEVYQMFSFIVSKITRFASSGFTHQDSIHDAAVFCAMLETIIRGE
jgi:hypothetical protein